MPNQCWFYFSDLAQLKQFVASNATQAKIKYKIEQSTLTPHWSKYFCKILDQLIYLNVYINKLICFYTIMSMPFEVSKGQKTLLFFVLVVFFHQKISIVLQRVQSSILNWPIMASLATSRLPSKHIPNHHGWPITSCWLLRWKYFDI